MARGVYDACDGLTVVVEDYVTVNIAGGFNSSFTKTDESCAGCDGSVTVAVTGGTPPFSYNLGNGAQASSTFTGLCSGTYSLSIEDAALCSGTLNVIIDPSSTIGVTSSVTNETCTGRNDGVITLSAVGGIAPYTYSIGIGASNSTGIFSGLAPNSYNYTVTDATGCNTSGIITVQPGTSVSANATATDATCGCDGSITVFASGGNGGPYEYSIDNGVTFQSSGIFTNVCSGNYTVVTQDSDACSGSTTLNVANTGNLAINSVTVSEPNCNGLCDASILINATGAQEYSIDGGVTFQTGNSFTNLCSGTFNLAVSDGGNCVENGTAVINEPAIVTLTANSADVLCSGTCDGSVTLFVNGGNAPYQYSINNGLNFQPGNLFNNLCPDSYNFLVSDLNNCTATAAATVGEPDEITLAITPANATCGNCNGQAIVITSGGFSPFSFSIPGVTPSSDNLIANLCSGSYLLTATDANNCTATISFDVDDMPFLVIDAGEDDSLVVGESVTLNPSFSDNSLVNTILWTPSTALSCFDCQNPDATPISTIIYTLNVTDNNGCVYADEVQVTVYSDALVNIPNAFTPNGDNLNDFFLITGREIKNINLLIYNRWGEKIFQSRDINYGWDGAYRGKLMDPGVFVYSVEIEFLTGKKEIFKGSLTLIR